ncbi:MAG: cytidylate kinase family protein [Candidatus Aenigmatarchaeota archaeon]
MRRKRAKEKIVVAISGPPAVGSTSVAKAVAKKLGLPLLVVGKLQKRLVRTRNESMAALLSWRTKYGSSRRTHTERDMMQVERAKRGNVVICSKLAVHFLRDVTPYKIWLHAPLAVRARRAAQRDGTNVKETFKEISERERIERREWKRIYGFDYFQQRKTADLVVDSSKLTLKQTVDRIVKFVRSKKKSRHD